LLILANQTHHTNRWKTNWLLLPFWNFYTT